MIKRIEAKRARSESVLLAAIINNELPDDADVEYFNKYTNQIDELRKRIRRLED